MVRAARECCLFALIFSAFSAMIGAVQIYSQESAPGASRPGFFVIPSSSGRRVQSVALLRALFNEFG
jgi:hypothetical protein